MRFRKPKCKHTFDVVGANRVNVMPSCAPSGPPVDTYTDVLKVCAWCGTHRVEKLRGHWTLEQLHGLNPTAAPVEDS